MHMNVRMCVYFYTNVGVCACMICVIVRACVCLRGAQILAETLRLKRLVDERNLAVAKFERPLMALEEDQSKEMMELYRQGWWDVMTQVVLLFFFGSSLFGVWMCVFACPTFLTVCNFCSSFSCLQPPSVVSFLPSLISFLPFFLDIFPSVLDSLSSFLP